MTRYLCIEDSLDFFQNDLGGHEAISQHAKEMLDFGEKLLLESFHVATAPFPQTMRAPYMRIVGEYFFASIDPSATTFLVSPRPRGTKAFLNNSEFLLYRNAFQ